MKIISKLNKFILTTILGITSISMTVFTVSCKQNQWIKTYDSYVSIHAVDDSSFELINHEGNNPNLIYSFDNKIWNEYKNEVINIPKNVTLYLVGNNKWGWSTFESYSTFFIEGNTSISGNIMSLIDNGKGTTKQIPCDYCFYNLFNKSNGVCEISNDFLPAINLTEGCYKAMFHGCSSLRNTPDLPAVELVDRCYSGMFDICKSLTTTPNLPATVLAKNCYDGMFHGCESLENAPKLPAVNLTMSCYWGMFYNCKSLTKAPDLPAVELVESCYSHMFYGCTHLNYVWIKYSDTYNEAPLNAFNEWVEGCSSDGVFYYKGSDNPQDFHFPSSWVKQSNNLL